MQMSEATEKIIIGILLRCISAFKTVPGVEVMQGVFYYFGNFQDLDFLGRVFQCSVKVSGLVPPGAAGLHRNSAE